MPAPSPKVISERLQKLRGEIEMFKSKQFTFADSDTFADWRQEVGRWLEYAGPYATKNSEAFEFRYIVWRPSRGDLAREWQSALNAADRLLAAVTENLEMDWSEALAPATPPQRREHLVATPAVQIINANLQINLAHTTLSDLLEGVYGAAEKEATPEKRSWLQKLRDVLDSPLAKEYFGKTLEAILKSQTR